MTGSDPRAHRRRRWVVTVLGLAVLAAGAVAVVREVSGSDDSNRGSGGNGSATSLATVERRTLSTQTQFNGTLGYAGSYPVLAQRHGTVTWLPAAGRVVRQGQVLYRVDGAPVVLLHGATPTWRALAEGALATDVTGADVAQLNHDLVALGYEHRADVSSAWDQFNWATAVGVEKMQEHLGVQETGRLDLGAVVFLPTAARVTTLAASLGGPAAGPVLSATSTRRTVSVALDASLRAEVTAGDRVTITLPAGRAVSGRVTSVGRVASASASGSGGSQDSGPTVPVTIRPTRQAATGGLDQALVEVAVTDRTVHNVLAIPVTALLALSAGGYAVEVVAGAHHLVRVTPGLFDDAAGVVQVSGPGLAAGQRVVVPGNE
jgi:hypothetical protein